MLPSSQPIVSLMCCLPLCIHAPVQARTMARYAARCMADKVDELGAGFAFEVRSKHAWMDACCW